ncbi:hypothetical protein LPJ78_000160 [Coemansia sp. RSA 989]|nr:hypothetical protein LPJ68_005295 [Coemansia sp. RSA 1086]KAJ1751003.1 hypothetical protein LPJ79_002413 [Coemansia sp. RSA 1821]KAJ1868412.1 hypothetical protein LPJ78_000160 [Coemansia sp. RSA 989]KAJ1872305.1 hypothetical protein LPJ55_003187 [Coemansia sp. RSA 990]KAJ2631200.1 hypothetical protein H4R22_002144 [Coemansia sp. RSA 1290]KAJ2652134.1 hypothetical protein IWW40_001331 [Coemansia sp. RSA 1250]
MPRRRYRRIEWNDAMASQTTLVECATATGEPAGATTESMLAANTRPSQLRGNSTAPRINTNASRTPSEGTPVVRSESEQTNSGAGSSEISATADKVRVGIMQRIRESLRRQLRNFGTHVMQAHFHESAQGIDGYYSVSMH